MKMSKATDENVWNNIEKPYVLILLRSGSVLAELWDVKRIERKNLVNVKG